MKKYLSIILITLLCLNIFVGCSRKEGNKQIDNENTSSKDTLDNNNHKDITLTFASWGVSEDSTKDIFETMAAEYKKINPHVTIDYISIPFGDIKKQTFIMSASNDAPDIIQTHTAWFSTYAASDIVVPLDDLLGKAYVDDLITSLRDDYTYRGQLMGVPWAPSPYILYWNKELFEQAGLDPETPPKTYDDMIAYAEKIAKLKTDNGDKIYGFGEAADKLPINGLVALRNLYSFGGSIYDEDGNVNINTPEVKAMFTFYKKLANDDLTPTSAKLKDLRNLFSIGRLGMYMDGYYGKAVYRNLSGKGEAFDKVWGAALVPHNATGDSVSIGEAHGLVISKDCKNPDVAADFIKFITDKEMITKYHQSNDVLSARKSFASDPDLNDNEIAKVLVDQLNNHSHALPPNNKGMEQGFLEIAGALQKVMLVDTNVDDVIEELNNKLKGLLE